MIGGSISIGIDDPCSGPYDPALMEAYAVNRAVNSVKNDTEECIEPVPD
jgi:putative SOS response-associated peptidase YedK